MEIQHSRRRRPARSCVECRRRKIKCDRNKPCAHCTTTKSNCTYRTYASNSISQQQFHRDGLPASPTVSAGRVESSAIHQWSSTCGTLLDHHDRSTTSGAISMRTDQNRSNTRTDSHPSGTVIDECPSVRPDLRDYSQRVQRLERTAPENHSDNYSEPKQAVLTLRSKLQDGQISLDKARVIRWTQWWGAAQEFETLIACFTEYSRNDAPTLNDDPEYVDIVAAIRELLAQSKVLARMIKTDRPSRTLTSPALRLTLPSRDLADKMTNNYFDSFESTYRMLHIPTFWADYERHWSNPETTPVNQRLKILLVTAIGFGVSGPQDEDTDFRATCVQWIYAAQTWLSGPLEKDRLDVSGLQIHCLTILAREVFSIGGDLLWMSMGSLVHRAMQIGLHRDPKLLPVRSLLQAEVRRRLWVTILEMIVQSSLDSGMPARISFDEFDSQAPSNVDDGELNDTIEVLQPRPNSVYTSSSIQLALFSSLPARLRAVQLLYGLHTDLSYIDVLALTSELTDKCRESTDFMRKHAKSHVTTFHQNIFDFMIRRFLLPLHSPFASQARTNPLFSYSLKLGLNTAVAIMSPEADVRYFNLRAAGGGSFKETFRGATVAIGLELLSQVESQRCDGTLHLNSQDRELLKRRLDESIEFSLERIKRGETNIKHHMFLSMMLAQAEAVEQGVSCELKMAKSAKKSLELCHGILRTRINTSTSLRSSHTDFSSALNPEDVFGTDLDVGFFLTEADPPWF